MGVSLSIRSYHWLVGGRTQAVSGVSLGLRIRDQALVKHGKSLKTTPIHFLELHCLSGMNMGKTSSMVVFLMTCNINLNHDSYIPK